MERLGPASDVVVRLLLVVAALAVNACGDDSSDDRAGAGDATAPAVTKDRPTPKTNGLPPELVGTWVSGEGVAEFVYVIAADGSYKHAEVLVQPREAGLFKFTIAARGTVEVDGDEIVITPTSGTKEIQDPDDPSSNSKEPIDTSPERYSWRLDASGTQLELTDAEGTPLTYVRE